MKLKSFPLFFYVFCAGLALLSYSCKEESAKKKPLTERIQYDVLVKSPGPDYPWWVQNLEGPSREKMVGAILKAAYEGRVKAYDIGHKLLTPEEVKAIGNRTDTIIGTSPNPPYNDTVMVMKQQLEINNIDRIRFLEEWYFDEATLQVEKKVFGIALVRNNYDEQGNFRGLEPLFYVYFNPEYPAKFEVK
jgi:hypothetical protein